MPEQPPRFITKWGTEGEGDGQFNLPHGVAVDSSGNVYRHEPWKHSGAT